MVMVDHFPASIDRSKNPPAWATMKLSILVTSPIANFPLQNQLIAEMVRTMLCFYYWG